MSNSHPFLGIYMLHRPFLLINDPELIKHILVKDFSHFCDRGLYCNEKTDPLNAHLFLLSGDKWRTLRAKLSPTFTSGKLKCMFPLLKDIGDELIRATDEYSTVLNTIEIKDLIAR